MIKIQNLTKSYGTQEVLENVSFTMSSKEKIGLIGRNGSGKSTLFKIIQGIETSDEGSIQIPKYYQVASLSQTISFTKETVIDECCQVLLEEEKHEVYKAEKILFGLGLSKDDITKSPKTFSGGYQVRICLAKVLLQNPNLLLLDEPTNYLDIVSLRWLEKFLKNYPGEVIIITHDKTFMDNVCTHVMGITRKSIRKVKGSTSNYYQQIQLEEEKYEQTRLNHEKKKQELEQFVNRFKAKASKAKQAQSRVKQLEKMGEFDKLSDEKLLGFKFPYRECPAKVILKAENISFSYNAKDQTTNLIDNFNLSLNSDDKIAIIGKNGKGKSTLLNLLANELIPKSGTITTHPSTQRGHFGQTNIERLNLNNNILEEIFSSNQNLGNTDIRKICGTMMFSGSLAEKKIQVLSGGERSRVLIGKLLAKPSNILLLDEPTNHLDMQSVESLGQEIQTYPGALLIVTHNESLLRKVANKLIVFHKNKIEFFNGNYDEFLNKIGWEEEETPQSKKGEKILSKKEYKLQRTSIIQERSKVLSPLKKEIKNLEAEIDSKEKLHKQITKDLISASNDTDANSILQLATQVEELESSIESMFNQLVLTTEKQEAENNKYQEMLNKLDGL
jgi:ATP-binding cassette, subfamily F, member 3